MNYLGLFLQHLHDDLDLRQKRLAYFGQDKKPRISLKKTQVYKIHPHYVCKALNRNSPLHPNISIHILHTVLYTLAMMYTRRICLTIMSCFR